MHYNYKAIKKGESLGGITLDSFGESSYGIKIMIKSNYGYA